MSSVVAGEAEQAVIDKVVAAYGGSKLVNLKTITINSEEFSRWEGQGYYPGTDQPVFHKQILTLNPADLIGKNQVRFTSTGVDYNYGDVVAGDKSTNLSYSYGTYSENDEGGYYGALGPYIRGIDTLLAYELHRRKDTAKLLDPLNYRGQPHHQISFEFPESPPLILSVDQQTGLINKMTRIIENTEYNLAYQYDNHVVTDGITHATQYAFINTNQLQTMVIDRSIEVNRASKQDFAVDKFLVKAAEQMPISEEPQQTRVADDYYHITVDDRNSSFIDAGDYIISIGSTAGFGDRWDVFKNIVPNKPLKYHVVTHHHSDHLEGVEDAFDAGAILVVPDTVVASVEALFDTKPADGKIMSINKMTTLGPVDIHLFSSNHAEKNALLYARNAKTVFQADHYGGEHIDAPSPASLNTVYLKETIDALGLELDYLVGPHSRKVHRWQDFVSAVAAYNNDCPQSRTICR